MLVRIFDIPILSENNKFLCAPETDSDYLKLYYGDQKSFTEDLTSFFKYLSLEEQKRSKRFLKLSDERTYVISHALLNQKISEVLRTDFRNIKIRFFDRDTKPFVENEKLDFNLSHSSEYFAFAISNRSNSFVGVDIEKIRENLEIEPIISNYFHKNEASYILSNKDQILHRQRFYRIWTRKEAFLKMLGIGLSENLSNLDLSATESEFNTEISGMNESDLTSEIFIYSFLLHKNLAASVAINHPVNLLSEQVKDFTGV